MSVGLILEGGGMRGIFVAGVTDYFLENNIVFPNVIGVSAGACHGCSFVCSQKGRAYAVNTDYLENKEYCSFHSLRKTGELFGSDFIYKKIPEELYPIDNEAFKKSGIKFQTVITNCVTGEAEYPVVEDMFSDVKYVRASSSLPLLAQMVPIDGGVYLDGGITDSIPVIQSVAQGNKKNVVVLTREREYRKGPNKMFRVLKTHYRRYPKLVKAIENRHRVYNETLRYIAEEEKKGNIFVIAPMGSLDIGRVEKNPDKLRKAYREGYFVAEGLGEKLKKFLED